MNNLEKEVAVLFANGFWVTWEFDEGYGAVQSLHDTNGNYYIVHYAGPGAQNPVSIEKTA